MINPANSDKREEARKAELSKCNQIKQVKLLRKFSSLLEKDTSLKSEIKTLICEFPEEFNTNSILFGIDKKDESEIKSIIQQYILSNKSDIKEEDIRTSSGGTRIEGETKEAFMKRYIEGIVLGIKNNRKIQLNKDDIEQFNPKERQIDWLCDDNESNLTKMEFLSEKDIEGI